MRQVGASLKSHSKGSGVYFSAAVSWRSGGNDFLI